MKRKKYYKKIINYFKDKKIEIVIYGILIMFLSGLGFLTPYLNTKIV